MSPPDDPPVIHELMEWCFKRVPGAVTRHQRVQRLFHDFGDLINRQIPIITVAGTSGKGTTCALLEAVLTASGHVPGVYTKPHLVSFRERFRVAGRAVSGPELATHAAEVYPRLRAFVAAHGPDYWPTLYEALVLIAASIFARRGVTFAVYEAAVGGASCATALLPSVLSIVTSVDLDHQDDLGFSVEEIARDKAGIAPPGGHLILGAGVSAAARAEIVAACGARNVRCTQADDRVEPLATGVEGQTVRYDWAGEVRTAFVPFPGAHQALNFATVWAATQALNDLGHVPGVEAIRGVERAKLQGRFEFIQGSPSWLLDVAHNPASIEALIGTASRVVPKEQIVGIVGASERHDHRAIVNLLGAWGVPLGFCEGFPRAIPARQLLDEVAPGHAVAVLGLFTAPADAIDHCIHATALSAATVLITGSLFLVGQCRRELVRRGLVPGEGE